MKSIILFIGIICFFYLSSAQIAKRELPPKQEAIPITQVYDSTFFKKDEISYERSKEELNKYKGLTIYILPHSQKRLNQDYKGLCSKENLDLDILSMNSAYVGNQYLTIIDIGNGIDWVFKLRMENGNIIYYKTPNEYEDANKYAPFIFPKYLEKTKAHYVNKIFVVNTNSTAKDANSGIDIPLIKAERWVCVDLALVDIETEDFYVPMLIFKNSSGNEIFVNYAMEYMFYARREYMSDLYYSSSSYLYMTNLVHKHYFTELEDYQLSENQKLEEQRQKSEDERNRLQEIENRKKTINQKFGEHYGNLINNNKVVIGMTKEMCLLSWGKPIIEDVTTTEQGKYEVWNYLFFYSYLYFENNSLKIIKQYK